MNISSKDKIRAGVIIILIISVIIFMYKADSKKQSTQNTAKINSTETQQLNQDKASNSQSESMEKGKDDELMKQANEAIEMLDKNNKESKESYDSGITYEQLTRTPKDYMYHMVKFSGKVVQVMEDDKETHIRLAVNGDSNNIILGSYHSNISKVRILENDNVTIEGFSIGIESYTSTAGKQINIPGVSIDKIELNK